MQGDLHSRRSAENPFLVRVLGVHMISAENSHRYFAVNYLHHVAPNADISDLVAILSGADVNEARATCFNSLLDQSLCVGLQYAVAHRPGSTTSRRRSGGRVFAVVEDHAGVQGGIGIDSFAAYKIEKASIARAREIWRQLAPTDV